MNLFNTCMFTLYIFTLLYLKYLTKLYFKLSFRKLREQREAERQGRLRLGRQLEALRPKVSVKGRQSCAESTPTVFDVVSTNICCV